jgi:hypothetical protein
VNRSMDDMDGPLVAAWFYENILQHEEIDADVIAYAFDNAVTRLREQGVSPERWATFVHMGA